MRAVYLLCCYSSWDTARCPSAPRRVCCVWGRSWRFGAPRPRKLRFSSAHRFPCSPWCGKTVNETAPRALPLKKSCCCRLVYMSFHEMLVMYMHHVTTARGATFFVCFYTMTKPLVVGTTGVRTLISKSNRHNLSKRQLQDSNAGIPRCSTDMIFRDFFFTTVFRGKWTSIL